MFSHHISKGVLTKDIMICLLSCSKTKIWNKDIIEWKTATPKAKHFDPMLWLMAERDRRVHQQKMVSWAWGIRVNNIICCVVRYSVRVALRDTHCTKNTHRSIYCVNLVLHIVQTLWCTLCKGRCILCARTVAGHTQMGASHALRGSSRGHWLVCRWHSPGCTL